MEIILKYITNLTEGQKKQFTELEKLYKEHNEKINVISRKDTEHIYEHHILHSLSMIKFFEFEAGTNVLDIGTGGGLPGIPLAIMFPECKFHLVDSIGKKISVVKAISEELKLKNVNAEKIRAEEVKGVYDYGITRAVSRLEELIRWTGKKINKELICYKGGNLLEEINEMKRKYPHYQVEEHSIYSKIEEDFFRDKKILVVSRKS